MSLAPIILFVYNRPHHTEKTLESLMANGLASESELYIFADGAKEGASSEMLEKIKLTRALLQKKKWCKKVTVFESESNKGLANSIVEGVTKIVNEYGKVIVLEDDLVTSSYFLQYMNDSLDLYAEDYEVACISGYVYPLKGNAPSTFFIKGADCWGWATWKRAWADFESDGKKLLMELETKNLTNEFDFEGTYPYTQMLKDCIHGVNNSWAIRWYASAFLKNKYCLYPGTSFVQNIGIDGSGTHSGSSDKWQVDLTRVAKNSTKISLSENKLMRELFADYFRSIKNSESSVMKRWIGKIKSILKR